MLTALECDIVALATTRLILMLFIKLTLSGAVYFKFLMMFCNVTSVSF